jgi:hypothetical protein
MNPPSSVDVRSHPRCWLSCWLSRVMGSDALDALSSSARDRQLPANPIKGWRAGHTDFAGASSLPPWDRPSADTYRQCCHQPGEVGLRDLKPDSAVRA